MDELKPCPFCGGKAFSTGVLPTYGFDVMYRAICEDCNISTPSKWTKEKAIEAWNRRVNNDVDWLEPSILFFQD